MAENTYSSGRRWKSNLRFGSTLSSEMRRTVASDIASGMEKDLKLDTNLYLYAPFRSFARESASSSAAAAPGDVEDSFPSS
jgi:hypothetical protein